MLGAIVALADFAAAQESVGPYPIYRTIGPVDGLPYQTATSTVQDDDGTYWIGCPVGVQRFVIGAPVKLYRFGDSLAPQSERWVLQLEREGDSLFAYTGAEVHTYNHTSDAWQLAPWKPALRESSGDLDLEKAKVGVVQYSASFKSFPLSLKQELPDLAQASLLLYEKGRAFLGTPKGLYELRRDQAGVWYSISGATPLGLIGNSVEGLGVDSRGNLLIGTGMYSVVVIHHLVLKNQWLALPEGATQGAWGIAANGRGKLWVSTRQAISFSDAAGDHRLRIDESLKVKDGMTINHICYQKGNLFAGTSEGVVTYRNANSQGVSRLGKFSKPIFVYRVSPTADGGFDVYAAGEVFHVNEGGRTQIATGKLQPSFQYFDGLRASDDSYWVAGVRGLFRADRFGESLKAILPSSGETSTDFPVIRILEAPSGDLFVACLDGGLWRTSDGVSMQRITGKAQAARSIYSAEVDGAGRVWMGTNNGLTCYNPEGDQWHYFTPADGYPISDHNQGSSIVLPDGRVAFGGTEGVFVFHPDSLLRQKLLPTLGIVSVALDDIDKPHAWPFPKEIAYGYEQRRLDLSFALLGALDTVGLVPEIRLVGKDELWRKLRGMRLDFDGLTYGEYTLEARVRDRQTGLVGAVSSVTILRPPPWYATWWARGAMALGIIGLVGFAWSRIVTIRLRRKLEKMELENRINAERVRIARDLHDNVGSTLTYLTTSLRRMKDQAPEADVQSNLNDLQELSQDTLWQLRETIWAASHKQVTLGEFSERLGAYLRRLRVAATPAKLRAFLPTESQFELAPGQGLYMFRIVQEALTNAVKYAAATQINIRLEQTAEVLELEISDDGIGFDESQLPYTSGVGSIRERGKEMHAEVSLTTSPGNGTQWVIRFPLSNTQNSKTP